MADNGVIIRFLFVSLAWFNFFCFRFLRTIQCHQNNLFKQEKQLAHCFLMEKPANCLLTLSQVSREYNLDYKRAYHRMGSVPLAKNKGRNTVGQIEAPAWEIMSSLPRHGCKNVRVLGYSYLCLPMPKTMTKLQERKRMNGKSSWKLDIVTRFDSHLRN